MILLVKGNQTLVRRWYLHLKRGGALQSLHIQGSHQRPNFGIFPERTASQPGGQSTVRFVQYTSQRCETLVPATRNLKVSVHSGVYKADTWPPVEYGNGILNRRKQTNKKHSSLCRKNEWINSNVAAIVNWIEWSWHLDLLNLGESEPHNGIRWAEGTSEGGRKTKRRWERRHWPHSKDCTKRYRFGSTRSGRLSPKTKFYIRDSSVVSKNKKVENENNYGLHLPVYLLQREPSPTLTRIRAYD